MRKINVFTFILLLSELSFAACPEISGNYVCTNKVYNVYDQTLNFDNKENTLTLKVDEASPVVYKLDGAKNELVNENTMNNKVDVSYVAKCEDKNKIVIKHDPSSETFNIEFNELDKSFINTVTTVIDGKVVEEDVYSCIFLN